ncbi:MAG: hypothetical protein ACOX5Z_11555 [Desulfobulbus sp.]|jgi:hypothetical protein
MSLPTITRYLLPILVLLMLFLPQAPALAEEPLRKATAPVGTTTASQPTMAPDSPRTTVRCPACRPKCRELRQHYPCDRTGARARLGMGCQGKGRHKGLHGRGCRHRGYQGGPSWTDH